MTEQLLFPVLLNHDQKNIIGKASIIDGSIVIKFIDGEIPAWLEPHNLKLNLAYQVMVNKDDDNQNVLSAIITHISIML